MGEAAPLLTVGRYVIGAEIAAGGMATVHLGRLAGAAGFGRVVAIKRLHRHLAKDPDFADMFVAEAQLASRIRHPNVVPTLDVVSTESELFVVLDYVEGESLSRLVRAATKAQQRIPLETVSGIVIGVLQGLHAAHNAVGTDGKPLTVIHRDVSPQNVLVGVDGVARVLDFGVAKAMGLTQTTRAGTVKGKIPYMPPEQLRGDTLDPRADLYAVGLILWECLAGKRCFTGDDEFQVAARVQKGVVDPPSAHNAEVSKELDEFVMKATHLEPEQRFADALSMAQALRDLVTPAISNDVGQLVRELARDALSKRLQLVAALEAEPSVPSIPSPSPGEPPTRVSAPSLGDAGEEDLPTVATDELETELSPSHGSTLAGNLAVSSATPKRQPVIWALVGIGVGVVVAAGVLLVTLSMRAEPMATLSRAGPAVLRSPEVELQSPPKTPPAPPPSASSAPPVSSAKPPPRRPAARAGRCNPPYILGPDGTIDRFKPECF